MCQYYKKLHPCGCLSKVQIARCHDAIVVGKVCVGDLPSDGEFRETARKSYIVCFDCIVKDAREENEMAIRNAQQEAAKQEAVKRQEDIEKRRKTALENMKRRDREEDRKKEEEKKKEQERVKRDGGLWEPAGSSRKKGRGGRGPSLALRSAPLSSQNESRRMGDFGIDDKQTPKSAGAGVGDRSGRVGIWGKRQNGGGK